MAEKSMAYDHAAYLARHITVMKLPATAASTSVQKFFAFSSIRVKRIDVVVDIAGTADAAGYDVLRGTSSLASLGIGTAAAAATGTGFVTDIALTSGQYLDIKTKAASATAACSAAIEWTFDPGANVTV